MADMNDPFGNPWGYNPEDAFLGQMADVSVNPQQMQMMADKLRRARGDMDSQMQQAGTVGAAGVGGSMVLPTSPLAGLSSMGKKVMGSIDEQKALQEQQRLVGQLRSGNEAFMKAQQAQAQQAAAQAKALEDARSARAAAAGSGGYRPGDAYEQANPFYSAP